MTGAGIAADRLIAQIADIVAAGLHLDQVAGRRGEGLGDVGLPEHYQRIYIRGTPEFAEAMTAGKLDRLAPPPSPATPATVARAESLSRGALPPTLKRSSFFVTQVIYDINAAKNLVSIRRVEIEMAVRLAAHLRAELRH